jgi:two-component system chemotaxis response regulator CheB
MEVFARQLSIAAKRETLVAEDGMALLPDRILVAPGDAHLRLQSNADGAVALLDRTRSPSGCLPSLDPMFESAAALFGAGALGVVMTGMGRDGASGAARLVEAGGSVIAQDEGSSAVWGMPRAVIDAGLACAVMPPEKIANRVASRTGEQDCR